MIYTMKLKEKYFDYIKYGTKEYEIRLNDDKRKKIKKGDFIEFQKEPYLEDKIIVEVDDLLYCNSFDELLNSIDVELLSDSNMKKEELKLALDSFYPMESQNEYGLVAIKLRKNIIINNSKINNSLLDNEIFNTLRNNYNGFDKWLDKINSKGVDLYYTKNNKMLTSIMLLKLKEIDSQQFDKHGNILKIRTFLITDKNNGIGTTYLKLIDNIAIQNSIDYIYLTIKINNNELINFMEKNKYKRYNQYNDEFVYYKEL